MGDVWEALGIAPTKDISAIKRAYAEQAKQCHPEEDPEGFLRLRKAYQTALDYAEGIQNASGFVLEDPVQAAGRCVQSLKEQGAQFIICLSHSGTSEKTKNSEDEQLAQKVEGIDLIISGHTHTTLEAPIVVGDTYIVSAGDRKSVV